MPADILLDVDVIVCSQQGHSSKQNTETTEYGQQLDELAKVRCRFVRNQLSLALSSTGLLLQQLQKLRADNKQAEGKLRKRRQKIEAQVEGWILKYDQVCFHRMLMAICVPTVRYWGAGSRPCAGGY